MAGSLRRLVLGPPLATSEATDERLTRPRAMGAFGLDALSSVAYGPDEILYVLVLAGSAGVALDLPVAGAIAGLLAIVAFSYRQTIIAYPHGGGSYTVARENLGIAAGLVAAAALMVDYLTTIAVSVTAGVAAIVAFVPSLEAHRVVADVVVIVLLVAINLRGVREAGAAFVIPTYLFIGSLAALLLLGAVRSAIGVPGDAPAPPPASESLGVLLVLRAFAGGCTAMTGVEAIANGVPAFRPPESRNAAGTLLTLALILGALFLGVAALGHLIGAVPSDQANVVAQIGQRFAGGTPLFYVVQVSSAVILLLAANTSFNGFPRLAAILANDDWFPHRFTHRGWRLAYSNGILVIGGLAIVLVVAFGGSTHSLIPLFAVGVFLCFTLSQAGMVRHWQRGREHGRRWKMALNATGAVVTGAVTLIVVGSKFLEGAWIVLLLVPVIVGNFYAIHRHYVLAGRELEMDHLDLAATRHPTTVLVPVAALNRATAEALGYAHSLAGEVTAVHFVEDGTDVDEYRRRWHAWAGPGRIEVLVAPYREVVSPLLDHVRALRSSDPSRTVTVVVPDVVPHALIEEPFHNQMALAIALALRRIEGVAVVTVPVPLRR